jgi:hypothetical protein
MHGPVVDNTPFDLGQRREPVRDGDGDAGYQYQRREDGSAD